MKTPVIITNFKTYESATGKKAVELARIHEQVAEETGVSFAVAVQAVDIYAVASAVSIPVFAQHVDAVEYGANTGYIVPESVVAAGAFGTLLNHSEKQIEHELLKASIERAQSVGLFVIACAQDHEESERIVFMRPDLIAVEPPELIGGSVSVSTSKPEMITAAVRLIGDECTLVGAGVKTADDVRIALELGACGVLLASGVTKADDPAAVLRELARGVLEAGKG